MNGCSESIWVCSYRTNFGAPSPRKCSAPPSSSGGLYARYDCIMKPGDQFNPFSSRREISQG